MRKLAVFLLSLFCLISCKKEITLELKTPKTEYYKNDTLRIQTDIIEGYYYMWSVNGNFYSSNKTFPPLILNGNYSSGAQVGLTITSLDGFYSFDASKNILINPVPPVWYDYNGNYNVFYRQYSDNIDIPATTVINAGLDINASSISLQFTPYIPNLISTGLGTFNSSTLEFSQIFTNGSNFTATYSGYFSNDTMYLNYSNNQGKTGVIKAKKQL